MNIGIELLFFTDNIYYNELNLNKVIKIFLIKIVSRNENNWNFDFCKLKKSHFRIDNFIRKIILLFFKFIVNLFNDFIKHENWDLRMRIRNITSNLITDISVK